MSNRHSDSLLMIWSKKLSLDDNKKLCFSVFRVILKIHITNFVLHIVKSDAENKQKLEYHQNLSDIQFQ